MGSADCDLGSEVVLITHERTCSSIRSNAGTAGDAEARSSLGSANVRLGTRCWCRPPAMIKRNTMPILVQ